MDVKRDQSLISEFTDEGQSSQSQSQASDEGFEDDSFFASPKEEKNVENDSDELVDHEIWPDKHELVFKEKREDLDATEDNSDDQESDEDAKEAIFSPDACLPAFKCVMFCPARYHASSSMRSSSRRFSKQRSGGESVSETSTADNSTSLGLDLLIEEEHNEEGKSEEVWVVNNVKVNSVLVDSPLEHGDILVTVNGNSSIQEALERALANRHQVLTLVVHNPDPRAQFDLVETWVHPSAYHSHDEDLSSSHLSASSPSRSISSSGSVPGFMGLHLNASSTSPYLKVDHTTDPEDPSKNSTFWEHALLGSNDLVLSVDRVPTSEASERSVARTLRHDLRSSSPITLHTQLRSTEGLALATSMQQQAKELPMNHPSRGKLSTSRTRLGLIVGLVATVAIILLILVAVNHKNDTGDDRSEQEDDSHCGSGGCSPAHLRHRLW